jgi:hypothetical protein
VETVGRRKWAVTDGYIPAWGNGPCPELESRDALQPTLKLPIRIQIWGLEMLLCPVKGSGLGQGAEDVSRDVAL